MTPRNIMAGFRACGICPFDPSVVRPISEDSDSGTKDIQEESSLVYVPLVTPTKQSHCNTQDGDGDYDSENSISSRSHSSLSDLDEVHVFVKESSIDRFFKVPSPPSKRSVPKKLPSCKVLTSVENLERINEKEIHKAEEAARREERKKEREARAERRKQEAAAKAEKKKSSKESMCLCIRIKSHDKFYSRTNRASLVPCCMECMQL